MNFITYELISSDTAAIKRGWSIDRQEKEPLNAHNPSWRSKEELLGEMVNSLPFLFSGGLSALYR
jgi:hypothetical protein